MFYLAKWPNETVTIVHVDGCEKDHNVAIFDALDDIGNPYEAEVYSLRKGCLVNIWPNRNGIEDISTTKSMSRKIIDRHTHTRWLHRFRLTDEQHKESAIKRICEMYKMPPVPKETLDIKTATKIGKRTGIYFAFNEAGNVVYVGKSINIAGRLSHRPELKGCRIGFLEFDEKDIHSNELFYIWLCKPVLNSQTKTESTLPLTGQFNSHA